MTDRRALRFLGASVAALPLLTLLFVPIRTIDDAFITFRYARNLASGNGLVFNLGERVEGATSLSWTLLLAAAETLRLPIEAAALVLGVAFAVLALREAYLLGRRLGASPAACLAAVALVAVHGRFWLVAANGLEGGLFAFLVVLVVRKTIEEADARLIGGLLGLLFLTPTRESGHPAARAAVRWARHPWEPGWRIPRTIPCARQGRADRARIARYANHSADPSAGPRMERGRLARIRRPAAGLPDCRRHARHRRRGHDLATQLLRRPAAELGDRQVGALRGAGGGAGECPRGPLLHRALRDRAGAADPRRRDRTRPQTDEPGPVVLSARCGVGDPGGTRQRRRLDAPTTGCSWSSCRCLRRPLPSACRRPSRTGSIRGASDGEQPGSSPR